MVAKLERRAAGPTVDYAVPPAVELQLHQQRVAAHQSKLNLRALVTGRGVVIAIKVILAIFVAICAVDSMVSASDLTNLAFASRPGSDPMFSDTTLLRAIMGAASYNARAAVYAVLVVAVLLLPVPHRHA